MPPVQLPMHRRQETPGELGGIPVVLIFDTGGSYAPTCWGLKMRFASRWNMHGVGDGRFISLGRVNRRGKAKRRVCEALRQLGVPFTEEFYFLSLLEADALRLHAYFSASLKLRGETQEVPL